MIEQATATLKGKNKGNFKQLIKFYETKKYIKGQKLCSKILKKHPKHAETRCIQALFKHFINSKNQDSVKEAKTALMLNLKSPFCWNICGILYKLNKDLKMAAMSFSQALKYDPKNQQILREATNLFLLCRDYDKHLDFRRKMLFNKPSIMMNWCGFATANHLNGDMEQTHEALDSMFEMDKKRLKMNEEKGGENKGKGLFKKGDKNQIHLYRIRLFEEEEKWQEIVDYVEEYKHEFLDKLKMRENLVKAYTSLGDFDNVIANLETLLMYIPENKSWINQYCDARVAKGGQRREVLEELLGKNKRSKIIPVLIMKDLSADDAEFKQTLEQGFIKAVRKVSPTYFRELKSYYPDAKKTEIIEEVILGNLKSLEEDLTFRTTEDGTIEFPTSLMYCYYLLGWHYLLTGNLEEALAYSNKCEDHTPTFLENAILQAKIFKAMYKYDQAASVLEKYYKLDKADRYIINKTAKYLLLNNQVQEGDEIFKTVIMDTLTTEKTIHTLEKMWYEIEMGKAYVRQRKWGRGLRQFEFVKEHIASIIDDQGEFYNYTLRKYSLSQFIDLRRFADKTLYEDERMVKGLGNYLGSALVYLRNKEIEEFYIEEKTKGLKKSERNKYVKSLAKKRAEGSVVVPKDQVKELDLHGEQLLADFNIDSVYQVAYKARPSKLKHKKLVYLALFDYAHYKGNLLLSIKYYNMLTSILSEDSLDLLARRIQFLDLQDKTLKREDLNAQTQAFIKKHMAKYSNLDLQADQKALEERAKTCPLAQCASISLNSSIGAITNIQAHQQLNELAAQDSFKELLKQSEPSTVFEVLDCLNKFSVDYPLLKDLCKVADVELGVYEN